MITHHDRGALRFLSRHGSVFFDGEVWRAPGVGQFLTTTTIERFDRQGFTRITEPAIGYRIGRALTDAGFAAARMRHLQPRAAASPPVFARTTPPAGRPGIHPIPEA